jgi:amino acid adenylation domain-containing protein
VTTAEFVAHLRKLDIRVEIDGERLRCSAPKGVLTDAVRAELVARKAEIVVWMQANGDSHDRAAGEPDVDGHHEILPFAQLRVLDDHARQADRAAEGDIPLSFAQQRLWFLDQLEPGSTAYTIAARHRVHGLLDVTALTQALTELVRRHESLRTTFPSRDGEPVQRISDPAPVALDVIDLEPVSSEERSAVAWQRIREHAARPFDLACGPLFRAVLITFGAEDHEILMVVHHIVADGWSLGIIDRELMALYEAYLAGRPSPLPDLPIQYADFSLWQRQWLSGDALDAQRRYWREHLAGLPAPLQLPTYRRSGRLTSAGASYDFALPRPLADSLRTLSRREGATLFMLLLAAFKVLIARYSGQADIAVGTPVANRSHVELEPVVGFFANTLILRTDLAGDPSFRELLTRVRETCLGAYAHPDMPFEKLVEELRPERTLGQNPLFQLSFVLQDAAAGADLAFVTVASPFDLTLFIRNGADGALSATVQYKRDLFEPETIARLAGHYRMLLENVASDPDCRISALSLLTPAEWHRLIVEWNDTASVYPAGALPEVFEGQVERSPEAVALLYEEQQFTYRELNRRANRIAHRLRALGVGPDALVAVCLERSPDMVVACLGVLKAGGAYVPLDPAYPTERLAFMLADSQAVALLTRRLHLERLPECLVPTICVDVDADALERESPENPAWIAGPGNLAYVMYTSGSTGLPKGVAIAHCSILRLLFGISYARLGPNETVLHASSPSFDLTTFELWGPLLHGGQCVLFSGRVPTPDALREVIEKHGVTTIWLTGSLFNSIVDVAPEALAGVQQLLVGGEALSVPHVRRVAKALPSIQIINGYGPTEATTFACCYHLPGPPEADATSIPIGRPIANTRVYVLDRHRRPVPIGVPGELWIAGDGLARGYVGRPELTAERFVVQRLSQTLEERLYRTGDLVRWLGDGTLEFLGRLDDQVKVRGFRVELGEIQAALARHPRVRESVVVARHAPNGGKGLVAYVVGDGALESRGLREFLGRKLPDYMVPPAFVVVDRLPRGANGKVDRRALPEPDAWAELVHAPVEPRDELERQLVGIWQDILSISPVGTRDSFFDLGGHSLLALRMFARIEKKLGVALPVATLFETPTIEGLATLIRKGTRPASERSLVAIQPAGNRPPVFGMPGVGGNVLNYVALARLLGSDQPFYGLQSRGLDGSEEPLTRIEDIAAEFLREIREVHPDGPYHLVGMCMGGVVAYEMAQQLRAVGQQIGLLVLLETWAPGMASARRFRCGARTPAVFGFVAGRLRLYVETLARLRGRERLQYLLGRLRLLTDMVVQPDVLRGTRRELYLQTVTRANLLAFQQYEPRVYPGPVVLFRAEGRKVAPAADYRLSWRDLVTGGLQIYSAPGDDSGLMLQEPHVQVLAAQLKMCIESARTSLSPPRAV